ncbi:MAG: PIG-L family deacetylase [Deltaproteobacteria bacterium]|nr:PIG-L family deacetylase [Deltaproteobacteria bacterium]
MKEVPVPQEIFAAGTRHLFVFAHQDDEIPFAGILQRALPHAEAVWMTNGDGLAPAAGIAPGEYAEIRENETIAAMAVLGWHRSRLDFLRWSELALYPLFVSLSRAPSAQTAEADDRRLVASVAASMEECLTPKVEQADVVWAQAWQGGHPEHDIAHFLAAKVVKDVSLRQNRRIHFFELPSYELTVLVPLRFGPWKRGPVHRIRLTDPEMRLKEAASSAYRSQAWAFAAFRKIIGFYGVLSALRLKPFTFRNFGREEQFGPVPTGRSYLRSPHGFSRLDYIREDYRGRPVTFPGSIARFVELAGGE